MVARVTQSFFFFYNVFRNYFVLLHRFGTDTGTRNGSPGDSSGSRPSSSRVNRELLENGRIRNGAREKTFLMKNLRKLLILCFRKTIQVVKRFTQVFVLSDIHL